MARETSTDNNRQTNIQQFDSLIYRDSAPNFGVLGGRMEMGMEESFVSPAYVDTKALEQGESNEGDTTRSK